MIQINFDGKSKNYDEHMKNTGHYLAQQILIKRCLQKIKEPILDVSCGTGVILNTLENYFLQLIGNDDSKKMIEIAKSKTKTTKYICNDLMKINENKKYNTIICANTLFYFKDKLKTIAKLKN
jgi:ubiquinone/menaquinone biosynthesis C-methylase UbiE